jgi:uncharacterized membrane protein YozB (DUF420 family)
MLLAAAHPIVHLNAALNATATVLLVIGWLLIKRGRVTAHMQMMFSAFAVSTIFLACYLWYHYQVGSVRFTHPGAVRYVYLAILVSHVLLAFSVPVMAIWTIYLGLRASVPEYRVRHRRLARWTLPIWLYVSVTGVIVYVMLYHLWPPEGL